MPGLLIDSSITLVAVVFLLSTGLFPRTAKSICFAVLVVSTAWAVLNNLLAIDALGSLAAGSDLTMSRRWLTTLACVAFSGLSCSIFAPDRGELPPVSAGPPPRSVVAPALRESEVAAIATALSRRPTGLTASEVDAVARTVVGEAHRHGSSRRWCWR